MVTLIGLGVAVAVGGWIYVFFAVVLLWIALYLWLLYRQFSMNYRLTSQRFIHESGILRRVTDRIEVIDMDDITLEQGPIDQLLGVGTIKVTSSDRTHPEFWLYGIERAGEVATMIDDARRAERQRRGLHIEAV